MRYLINKTTKVLICLVTVENYSCNTELHEIIETELQPNAAFHVKKWNGTEWIEGATPEEIEQQQLKQINSYVSDFRILRKRTAKEFSDDFADNITKVLIGKPSAEVDEVDEQLIDTAHKILDRINSRNSDYWTARREINAMTPPTNSIALQFFNLLKTHINDFVIANYPTEEL